MFVLSLHGEEGESMELLHDPQSASPRRGGLGTRLRTIHRTAVRGIRVSTNSSHTLTASETLALDSTDYVGAFLFHGNSFSKYLFDDGYVTYTGSTPSMYFYLRDHQGNNRAVAEFATLSHVNASLSQTTYYYPSGVCLATWAPIPSPSPISTTARSSTACTVWIGTTTVPASTTPPSPASPRWIPLLRSTTTSAPTPTVPAIP